LSTGGCGRSEENLKLAEKEGEEKWDAILYKEGSKGGQETWPMDESVITSPRDNKSRVSKEGKKREPTVLPLALEDVKEIRGRKWRSSAFKGIAEILLEEKERKLLWRGGEGRLDLDHWKIGKRQGCLLGRVWRKSVLGSQAQSPGRAEVCRQIQK